MFRRDPEALAQWMPQSPAACAQRQGAILDFRRPGRKGRGRPGLLHLHLLPRGERGHGACLPAAPPGVCPGAYRRPLWPPGPGDATPCGSTPWTGARGHFVAQIPPGGGEPLPGRGSSRPRFPSRSGLWPRRCIRSSAPVLCRRGWLWWAGRVLLVPPALPELSGLGVLRAGVELAEVRGKRLEPLPRLFYEPLSGGAAPVPGPLPPGPPAGRPSSGGKRLTVTQEATPPCAWPG